MDDLTARIETNPAVMGGKPVIRGTRVTVERVLIDLSAGESDAELLEMYPRLTTDDVRAAQAYAAKVIADRETLAVP